MNKHSKYLPRSVLALAAAMAMASPAMAEVRSYSVQHQYAFYTSNWAYAWANPYFNPYYGAWGFSNGVSTYQTYARADNQVRQSYGYDWIPANGTVSHTSTISDWRASATASATVSNHTTAWGYPSWYGGWAGGTYTWGTTTASGTVYTAPNSGGYAYAASSEHVDFGYRQWGYYGNFYWRPTLNSTVAGSASSFSPWIRTYDPVTVSFVDPADGLTKNVDLLTIEWQPDSSDMNSGFDWNPDTGVLSAHASKSATFTMATDARYVDNPGTLTLSFDANGYGTWSTTGSFAGASISREVDGSLTVSVNDINFSYALPTDTYQISIGGGVGPIPEPGTWALMLSGIVPMGLRRLRRKAVKAATTQA